MGYTTRHLPPHMGPDFAQYLHGLAVDILDSYAGIFRGYPMSAALGPGCKTSKCKLSSCRSRLALAVVSMGKGCDDAFIDAGCTGSQHLEHHQRSGHCAAVWQVRCHVQAPWSGDPLRSPPPSTALRSMARNCCLLDQSCNSNFTADDKP